MKRAWMMASMFLIVFSAGSAGAAELKDYIYNKKGDGKLITGYRYFRTVADAAGGIAVVSSPLYQEGDAFLLPAYYAEKRSLEKTVKLFTRLFPVYRYRFARKILNIYPLASLADIRGNGRMLPPDRWISEGDALVGRRFVGIWEPLPGHTAANFRIPLFRKKGDDAVDAARAFCAFYPEYQFMRRKSKVYIFPRGQWPRVAAKYGEPLVQIGSGLTLTAGLGALLHAGYIFRLQRFFVEPRLGFGFVVFDEPDSGVALTPSVNLGWNAIFMDTARWYVGLRLMLLIDAYDGDTVFKPALLSGFEYYNAFTEGSLSLEEGKPVIRLGAGWRF